MALDSTNLYKLGGANPGIWHYRSTDAEVLLMIVVILMMLLMN